ncbi:hypothetical protein [Streptomyces sp. NRRL B-24484]|uniref:hypothetical protein n=1 Tax=Streptomyces sp. NRRL B-24484 TaxID=1463833 RepID=UPI0004C0F0E0|nr:hypothetical protein [Streptomyces sp. NRRL B-24484]
MPPPERRTAGAGAALLLALCAAACTPSGGAATAPPSAAAPAPARAPASAPVSAQATTERPAHPPVLAVLDSVAGGAGGHTVHYRPAVFCAPHTVDLGDCARELPSDGRPFVAAGDPGAERAESALTEGAPFSYYLPSGDPITIDRAEFANADAHGGFDWRDAPPAVELTFGPTGAITAISGIRTAVTS